MKNYYPWNVQALVDWLNSEFGRDGYQRIEAALKIPGHVVKSWRTDPSPTIELSHIYSIAHYRGWNLQDILKWLEIKEIHLQELINQGLTQLNPKKNF